MATRVLSPRTPGDGSGTSSPPAARTPVYARRDIPYAPDRKYQKELVARSQSLHAQREQLRPALARMMALIYDGSPDNASAHLLSIPITEAPDMHVHPLSLLSGKEVGKLEMYVSGLQMEVSRLEDQLERRLEQYGRTQQADKDGLAERVEGLHRQQDGPEKMFLELPHDDSLPPAPDLTPAPAPAMPEAATTVAATQELPPTTPSAAARSSSSSSSSRSSCSSRSRSNSSGSSATATTATTTHSSAKAGAASSPPPKVDVRLTRVGHWPKLTSAEMDHSKAFPHTMHPGRFAFSPALSVAALGSLLARSGGRRMDQLEREVDEQLRGVRPNSIDSCARLWRQHAQSIGLAKPERERESIGIKSRPSAPVVSKYLVAAILSAK